MGIRGRKPKVGTSREKYLRVRMTDDELERTEQAAASVDLNRSDYVREVVARDVKRKGIR